MGVEVVGEQVPEGHGVAAGIDGRDGLRRRQLAAPHRGDGAQRLHDRLDRAEVGTGADDDLRAGPAQRRDGP